MRKQGLLCLLLLLLIMVLPPSAAAADTMFRNDPQHTGVFDNGGVVPTNTELWRFKTGDFGSPVVTGGVVYLGGNLIYLGSGSEHNLYAIDAATGTELWRFSTGGMVDSTPAVASGIVYIGSGDSNLYAINAATGKEKWRFPIDGDIFSSPSVEDGAVYFRCNRGGPSGESYTYLYAVITGVEVWRFTTEGELINQGGSSPAVADGVVFVGMDNKNLYAIDAGTGKEKWRFETSGAVSSSPAVSSGVVFVGSNDKNLYAIDAGTGKEKWRFETSGAVSSSPAVSSGVVFVGSDDKNLYAIDAVTGKEKWRFATGDLVSSSPAVASGVVYVGSRDKNLYAIDTVTGRERWRFSAGSWVISSPAVESGVVYIVSWDGILYAVGRVSSTPTLNVLTTPKKPPIFPSSNNNFTLPIIVVLILLFLIGGGYAISRMKRKPSAGQLPDSETRTTDGYQPPLTGSSSGGWNSTAIANLLNRTASVEQKLSVLSRFKGPVQALIAKAREQFRSGAYDGVQSTLNTAENAIPSLAQCEERLKQWKKDGYTTTPLESLKTDDVHAIITNFQDFERDIAKLEELGRSIQDLKQSFSQGNADPSISQRIAIIASELKDPHSIAGIEREIEALEQILRDQQEHRSVLTDLKERADASLLNAGKFGRVPTAIQEKIASERVSYVESAIADLDAFVASAQPALTLTLDRTSLDADKWHKVGVQITNSGDAHAFDVSFSFSSEFETRWIKPASVDAGKSTTVEIGILPKKEGNIPLEITVHCRDGHERSYTTTHEFWIDVIDRMVITPEKEGHATPEQSPVSQFSPKPQTAGHLPQELADHYTESEFIGKGGFARVFKAKRKDGRYVAVKVPISLDASTGRSFIAEMQNWTKLEHPNIVRVFDYNIMPMPYFEMELCDGSLAEIKKPLEAEEAAWILFSVCEGLKYTHKRSIVHRDLKPQNILLKNGVPKISDWGLSKVISDTASTTATSFTPYYAAPEQVNNKPKSERTDIWQLGVILYEVSTGELPFRGDSVVEVAVNIATKDPRRPKDINPGTALIEPVILKCLNKDPAERYQSVLELQKDLGHLLRKNYAEQLTMSVSSHDLRKSAFYCGDLVMVNLLTGDITTAYKYLSDLATYAEGDVKADAMELSEQIRTRMEYGLTEVPDELIQKADFIVHKVSFHFRT